MNYIQNHKFYSADNEFLSGSNTFEGYVIRKGDTFTDTYNFPLTASSTYGTDLYKSEYTRDRLITDTLLLPHLLSSIQINVNDILTSDLINEKFTLLNDNTTYLYSRLQTPNSYLPSTSVARFAALTAIDGEEQWKWFNSIVTSSEYHATSSYQQFEYINRGIGVTNATDASKFTLFCTTSTSFIALTGSTTDLQRVEESVYVSQSNNDLTFTNITCIDFVDKYMYICDKGNNAVYKYDVESYFIGDSAFINNRVFIESIGGIGNTDDKGLLKQPTLVAVKNDAVAVYDSGNNILKIYDNNFNHRKTLSIGNLRREPIVALRYNKFTGELYALTITSLRALKLYRIQEDFSFDAPITLAETLAEGEEVKEIVFSENDTDYWYLATTFYIYKRLVSKPKDIIGAYDGGKLFLFYTYKWNYAFFTYNGTSLPWNTSSNKTSSYNNFLGITCAPLTTNFDRVYLFTYGRFYSFDEPNNFINLLNFSNRENYSINSISISSKEFVQPSVYNKELYKILSNLLTIKNNIIGKYYGSYDLNGIYRLLGYNYQIDLSVFTIDNIRNFALHQNEGINYFSVNRTLTKIFKLQQVLLDAIDIENNDLIPYPLTSNTLIID